MHRSKSKAKQLGLGARASQTRGTNKVKERPTRGEAGPAPKETPKGMVIPIRRRKEKHGGKAKVKTGRAVKETEHASFVSSPAPRTQEGRIAEGTRTHKPFRLMVTTQPQKGTEARTLILPIGGQSHKLDRLLHSKESTPTKE